MVQVPYVHRGSGQMSGNHRCKSHLQCISKCFTYWSCTLHGVEKKAIEVLCASMKATKARCTNDSQMEDESHLPSSKYTTL
jgi:hypothetical protein